jgi:hypothetical protein
VRVAFVFPSRLALLTIIDGSVLVLQLDSTSKQAQQ